jgi:hypothetical protein
MSRGGSANTSATRSACRRPSSVSGMFRQSSDGSPALDSLCPWRISHTRTTLASSFLTSHPAARAGLAAGGRGAGGQAQTLAGGQG